MAGIPQGRAGLLAGLDLVLEVFELGHQRSEGRVVPILGLFRSPIDRGDLLLDLPRLGSKLQQSRLTTRSARTFSPSMTFSLSPAAETLPTTKPWVAKGA